MQGIIFFYTDMVVFLIFTGLIAFTFMLCEGDGCCCGSFDLAPAGGRIVSVGGDIVVPVDDEGNPVNNGEIEA
jgi:hypothetical protein